MGHTTVPKNRILCNQKVNYKKKILAYKFLRLILFLKKRGLHIFLNIIIFYLFSQGSNQVILHFH